MCTQVLGLGNIGAMVAESALALGMNVVGFDPKISVDAAWRLPSEVKKMSLLTDAFATADYVSINMPYIKGVTHGIISEEVKVTGGAALARFQVEDQLLVHALGVHGRLEGT